MFDNDGTLWIEQPMYNQFVFAIDEVKKQANQHPEWKEKEPFKSVLAGDMKAVAVMGEKGMLEIVAATHSGMTTVDFNKSVQQWLETAKHPRFKVAYADLVYQPMLELLDYLRANGFRTFSLLPRRRSLREMDGEGIADRGRMGVCRARSHLCAPNYCKRYRPAARHAEPIDTSTCHLSFRCVRRER